jgi:hypothetical protein
MTRLPWLGGARPKCMRRTTCQSGFYLKYVHLHHKSNRFTSVRFDIEMTLRQQKMPYDAKDGFKTINNMTAFKCI